MHTIFLRIILPTIFLLSIASTFVVAGGDKTFSDFVLQNQSLADGGDPDALGTMADLMTEGIYPGNLKQALELAKSGTEKGSPIAQYALGFLTYYGVRNELPADSQKGKSLVETALPGLKRLAENGVVYAQYVLGLVYGYGQAGIEANPEYAFNCVKKAAESGLAPAEETLSDFFKNGIGTSADEQKAKLWMQKAAENGYPQAQLIINDKPILLGVAEFGHDGLTTNPEGKIYIISCFREPTHPKKIISLLLVISRPSGSNPKVKFDSIQGIAINEDTGIPITQEKVEIDNAPYLAMRQLKIGSGDITVVANQMLNTTFDNLSYDFISFVSSYPKFSEWAEKAHQLKTEPFSKNISDGAEFVWDGAQAHMKLSNTTISEDTANYLMYIQDYVSQAFGLTINYINDVLSKKQKKIENIDKNFN